MVYSTNWFVENHAIMELFSSNLKLHLHFPPKGEYIVTVLVFGSVSMDITTYTPRLPALGETLFGHSFVTSPGGKGSNQAVAAALLGAPTCFVGRLGDDAFGNKVMEDVKAQGVDMSRVFIDSRHDTALAIISVDDNADNAITVISGVNMEINEEDVVRAEPLLDETRILLLQLEIPLEASLSIARKAQERGVMVIFDPAPAMDLPPEAYQLTDIITPNEIETEMLVGLKPTGREEAAKAAAILRERGSKTAIIKLGAQGVYYEGPGGSGFVPAFKVESVDTVAAGDAFNGGLAVALHEGKSLDEAVRFAAAAGAIATTRPGAMLSMPHRDEVDELLSLGSSKQ